MSLPTLLLKGNLVAHKHSESQAELDKHRPVDYIMNWFERRVPAMRGSLPSHPAKSPADKILVIRSSTGSGKSTVMPAELFHTYFQRTYRNIACCQPRVFNAINIPVNDVIPYHTKEALANANMKTREALVLGENIGYQTGNFTKKPVKGLIYMTIGSLTQQINVMSNEDFMKKYAFIIVDEAHERSIDTDFVLYSLKKFIEANYAHPLCPFLIVTSATFDTVKFTDYLLESVPTKERYKNIIDITGFTFPIRDFYLDYDSADFVQDAVNRVVDIHCGNPEDFGVATSSLSGELQKHVSDGFSITSALEKSNPLDFDGIGADKKPKKSKGYAKKQLPKDAAKKAEVDTTFRDILIFVAGAGEIRKIRAKLEELNESHAFFKEYPVMPLTLNRAAVRSQNDDYKNIFRPIKDVRYEISSFDRKTRKRSVKIVKPFRRVIVATNVGETGITYPTLRYVIDTGYHNSAEFNPNFGAGFLINKPVTRGIYKQRRGRSGRKALGFAFPIYTEATAAAMSEDQKPDILKEDISLDILSLIIKETDKENINNTMPLVELFEDSDFVELAFSVDASIPDLTELDLLDRPSADSLHYALEKLFTLGAIDSSCKATELGFIMNRFRFITIEAVKMILSGYAWNAPVSDLVTIACFLEARKMSLFGRDDSDFQHARANGAFSPFTFDGGLQTKNTEKQKMQILTADSFIQFITIFTEFQRVLRNQFISGLSGLDTSEEQKLKKNALGIIEGVEAWCQKVGLNYKELIEVMELRDQILQLLGAIGLDPFHNFHRSYEVMADSSSNTDMHDVIEYAKLIKQCVFEGFKLNMAVWDPSKKIYTTRRAHLELALENEEAGIENKFKVLKYGDTNPRFVIYSDIFHMRNRFENTYDPRVDNISVLDGFVPIDLYWDSLGF